MRLSKLLGGLLVQGDPAPDPEVAGVQHDSRRVEPGDLFVTWSGARHDGALFARQAADRGAVAIVADRPPVDERLAIPWLVAESPRDLLADVAAPVYGHPDRDLVLVGVTGTNGKSTVVELAGAILDAAKLPAGRLGTLGYRFRGLDLDGTERTTPEASDFFHTLRRMRDAGALAAAAEVSSHALAQGRVRHAGFDAAVFTNLTRDHFDFHQDIESYFETKALLFQQLKPRGRAVIHVDDPFGRRLAERHPQAVRFGRDGDVRPIDVELDARGTRGRIATPRGVLGFESSLLGRYNLENLLAAIATGEALAIPHEAIRAGIATTRPLPGRMEPVASGQPFPVFIDYAHTDAALEAALRSLREFAGRRIVLVFGCGGDRDAGKRPLMGEIAGRLADLPIATSDNPRSEDPLAILGAVEQGLKASGNRDYRVVPDRREAIRRAVAVASPGGWAVLVAGKGHEREQIIGSQRLPFSDREELERALAERFQAAVEE